jgi:hypothetical protein
MDKQNCLLLGTARLLGEKDGLDVGQHTTLGDGDTGEKLVQFFVITDGELEMSWDDPGLLVVTGCIACQLEDLSCQVFHDGSKIDWRTSSDTLSIVSLSQQTMDTTDWELKSGS